MAPSMVVEVSEPIELTRGESVNALHKMDLALTELLILTLADKSTFPGENVPEMYLEHFNVARTCGVQWVEQSLWYRYPILRHLAPHYSGFVWSSDLVGKTRKNFNEIVSLHKGNKDRSIVSYIDAYLEDIEKREGEEARHNGQRALIASLENFILGADAIVMGFYSLLFCLARYPDVQDRMRKEIVQEIERTSEGEEKGKFTLPYCWSVILEIMRYIPQAGFGGPHHTEEEIIVNGFKVPPGTDVYPNLIGIIRGEKYWDEPSNFNPARFLDQDGQCQVPKYWIPFEIGARACPGQSFALEVLFRLGLNTVSELKLSFDGFVDGSRSCSDDLRFFGMSLVTQRPYKLKVEKHGMSPGI